MAKIFKDGVTVDDKTGQVYQVGKAADAALPTPESPQTKLADAVSSVKTTTTKTPFELGTDWEGYDAALAKEKTTNVPTTTAPSTATSATSDFNVNDWLSKAFQTTETIKPIDLTTEKDRLETSKTSQLEALDSSYATNLSRLQQNNKDVGNALKAKLIKLGVSPSDSAWANVEAGQSNRNSEAESKLRSEYLSNKANLEANINSQISNLAIKEAENSFNTQVANISNKLQQVGQGISLYNIFEQRDQSEKDREQSAYNSMLSYSGTMAGLDQKKQEAVAKGFLENAQKGYYNVSDKKTLEMLAKLEQESPDYLSGLTTVATAGLTDRLNKIAEDALNMKKTEAEIAATNRSNRGSGGSSTSNDAKFWAAAQQEKGNLEKGEDWGTVWKRLQLRFPNIDANTIDSALGGSGTEQSGWAKPGAFEEWKQKQYKQGDAPQWQQQSGVWQWLASDEASKLSDDAKKQEIMSGGFNPEDFGIY